jgi:spoIIIJ-associated protein
VDIAVGFLEKIIKHMQLDAEVKVLDEQDKEIKMEIVGQNLGSLIGYHGEILDSLQYLTYLAVNKGDSGEDEDTGDRKKSRAIKISIDIENYREKREETLKGLARKMAERVQKYGRSVTLEPMNAYERRIIHATIQDIEGIVTHSIGQDNERKIIISKENKDRPYRQYNDGYVKKPRSF